MTCEIEVVRKVFDNDIGRSIKVGPDCDGLGLVEIDGGEEYGRVILNPEHALLLSMAIGACAREMIGPPTGRAA